MNTNDKNFIFFGTSQFSIIILESLLARGLRPRAIVTAPDRPQGRHMTLTPPPTKVWGEKNNIKVLQFESLRKDDTAVTTLQKLAADFYVVASYGKIIPQSILDIPPKGVLNVHPSLLPKFRGASPLQSSILADEQNTGVTIIKMDADMDHGPIVAIKQVEIQNWPPKEHELEKLLAFEGAIILADSLDDYLSGKLVPTEQNHAAATFTKKITKEDGHIELSDIESNSRQAFLKIQAFDGWPGTFFFTERKGKQIRVKIHSAHLDEGKLTLDRVTPEGGKEMDYKDFLKGL